MNDSDEWYVVKQTDGKCTILPASQILGEEKSMISMGERWGPYASQQDAIARRVGLIRAGKCHPA